MKIRPPFVNLLLSPGQSSHSGVLEDCVNTFVHSHLGDPRSHQTCSQDGKSPTGKRQRWTSYLPLNAEPAVTSKDSTFTEVVSNKKRWAGAKYLTSGFTYRWERHAKLTSLLFREFQSDSSYRQLGHGTDQSGLPILRFLPTHQNSVTNGKNIAIFSLLI